MLALSFQILSSEASDGLPAAPTRGAVLWPPSHRSFATLEDAVSDEARWIDPVGLRARAVIEAHLAPALPVHSDWGVKNVRFRGDAICAVYDWDSLVAGSEAEMVGRAAVQFTAQWDFSARLTPEAAEERAFVADYERARGRPFSSSERDVLDAAAMYSVAQLARLELAAGIDRADGFAEMLRARSV
jgi:hypothetical protein